MHLTWPFCSNPDFFIWIASSNPHVTPWFVCDRITAAHFSTPSSTHVDTWTTAQRKSLHVYHAYLEFGTFHFFTSIIWGKKKKILYMYTHDWRVKIKFLKRKMFQSSGKILKMKSKLFYYFINNVKFRSRCHIKQVYYFNNCFS